MSDVLVVSHDAGGAEIVSSWVKRHPQNNYRFIVDGPAIRIFEYKLGAFQSAQREDLERLIIENALVVTGTSWASSIEKVAIRFAKEHQTKVISFLDHWGNYKERFQLEDQQTLPDEIWVGDAYALKMAEASFPTVYIQLIENPYLLDIRDEINTCKVDPISEKSSCHILYICEPVSAHALKQTGRVDAFGYTEFEALNLFFSHLHALVESGGKVDVRIRSHPSEDPEKYTSYYVNESPEINVLASSGSTLVEDCAWSDWVVGMNSMALVIALEAGKAVFCCIPGYSRPNGLPHEGIRNFLEIDCICR